MADKEPILASISAASLTNTGNVSLTIVDGDDTFPVYWGGKHDIFPSSNPILVQANSKTIATITYNGNSEFSIKKGIQVDGARFDVTVSTRA